MLELRNIEKIYKIGDIQTKALNGISVSFRKKEFVAILGQSGSGKTTCLNIIGGLDRYDNGEMLIKGKNTKNFKDKDWDAYRNNSIGFVFQSYNLISHLSIVSNVELSMTLSGVSSKEKKERAVEALIKVGLKDHLHKKPNQLSGGQMQRVAIARALVNNPEILLCDEPTGALDSETSVQIMDLIQEISKDRLVIMVTHNPELAQEYADRIINFSDGNIVSDTNPHQESEKGDEFQLKKTSMSFFTALKLSLGNIRTKKGRTFLTSFASSIGIIGIAVILSLSTGVQAQIDTFQRDAVSEFPIMVSTQAMNMDKETFEGVEKESSFKKTDEVTLFDPKESKIVHNNNISEEYLEYVNNMDSDICGSIGYFRPTSLNLVRKVDDKFVPVTVSSPMDSQTNMSSMQGAGLPSYPTPLEKGSKNYLQKNYDVLEGTYPKEYTDLVLVINEKNKLDQTIMESLGFDIKDKETIKFKDIVGTKIKLVDNNDFYVKTPANTYLPGTDYKKMYESENSQTLTITGVVRQSQDSDLAMLATGIVYSDELLEKIIDKNISSDIAKAQKDADYNIFTKQPFKADLEKDMILMTIAGTKKPLMVMIYPKDFDTKEQVTEYLDKYNDNHTDDKVYYTDLAKTFADMTSSLMDVITWVLIGFAAISLVVSLIMIAIITYTSVLERTKEIGILKALGARKKDIIRVFDAETFILGVFSGTLGVAISYGISMLINIIVSSVVDIGDVSTLKITHALILIAISTILTVIGGHLPARMASKKDAVEALRSE